jgi:hypothetical protein
MFSLFCQGKTADFKRFFAFFSNLMRPSEFPSLLEGRMRKNRVCQRQTRNLKM